MLRYCYDPKFLDRWTNRSGQTVLTLIRLLLEEQSDKGLQCLKNFSTLWKAYLSESLFDQQSDISQFVGWKINQENIMLKHKFSAEVQSIFF